MAVTPHAIAQQNFIKSINATKPDTSGNVSITRVNSAASADYASRSTNNGSFFISGYEVSVG